MLSFTDGNCMLCALNRVLCHRIDIEGGGGSIRKCTFYVRALHYRFVIYVSIVLRILNILLDGDTISIVISRKRRRYGGFFLAPFRVECSHLRFCRIF